MNEWAYPDDGGTRRESSAEEELAWRQAARARSRHRFAVAAWCVLVAALTCGVVGFFRSDVLRLTQVTVRANDIVLAREVAAALKDFEPLRHTSALLPPVTDICRRAETCPRALLATASRQLPHGLLLEIEERKPRFAAGEGPNYLWVDDTGVFLLPAAAPGPEFPRVELPRNIPRATGKRLPQVELKAVLDCIEGAKQAGLAPNFQLDLQTPLRYTLTTTAGTPAWLGAGDNLQWKLTAAAAIERHWLKLGRTFEYIDVRIATRDEGVPYKLTGD